MRKKGILTFLYVPPYFVIMKKELKFQNRNSKLNINLRIARQNLRERERERENYPNTYMSDSSRT